MLTCREILCEREIYSKGFCKPCYNSYYFNKAKTYWKDHEKKKLEEYNNFKEFMSFCTYCKEPLTEHNTTASRMRTIIKSKKRSLPCRDCDNIKNKERRDRNKEHYENMRLERHFGITLGDYNKMFKKQKGLCYLCKSPPKPNKNGKIIRFSIDHNHQTGETRKLLCARCNHRLVGLIESVDDPRQLLTNLVKYFTEFKLKGEVV